MTEREDQYSGFYVGRLPNGTNDIKRIRVACFRAGATLDSILELTTFDDCPKRHGEIVYFSLVKNKILGPGALIQIKSGHPKLCHQEDSQGDRIIHTVYGVQMEREDLRPRVYRHGNLGEMRMKKNQLAAGLRYHSITFEVIIRQNAFFNLEVLSAQEYCKKNEYLYWEQVGDLELIRMEHSVGGVYAVFKLLNRSEDAVSMFGKWNDDWAVVMTSRHLEGDGKPFKGYLFEKGGKKERPYTPMSQECVVQLSREDQARFFTQFRIGEMFGFAPLETGSMSRRKARNQAERDLYHLPLPIDTRLVEFHDVLRIHEKDPEELGKIKYKNTPKNELNELQLEAVKMTLNDLRPLVCIHGGPGTGKTHCLSLLIYKLLKIKGKQFIVMASTKEELAILKEMTENIVATKTKELKHLHEHALMDVDRFTSIVNESPEAEDVFEQMMPSLEEYKTGKITSEQLFDEQEKKVKAMRMVVEEKILGNVSVVFATVGSPFIEHIANLASFKPSHCLIDGAARVKAFRTWPKAYESVKMVLAGDPSQFSATTLRTDEADLHFHQTIMERIMDKNNKKRFSWIEFNEQYRNHQEISDWSNGRFYGCELKNRTDPEDVLQKSCNPKPTNFPKLYDPLVLIDTSLVTDRTRVETYEKRREVVFGKEVCSYVNEEAKYAMQHYKNLIDMSIDPETIAIITPFEGQVEVIKSKMNTLMKTPGYEKCKSTKIRTINSVSGSEFDVVIFTLVRSNPRKFLGFLAESWCLNVAISRAKRHFMLIANAFMLTQKDEKNICALLDTICANKHRFHPANIFGTSGEVPAEVRNNYGGRYITFAENTNDEEMKQWCRQQFQ